MGGPGLGYLLVEERRPRAASAQPAADDRKARVQVTPEEGILVRGIWGPKEASLSHLVQAAFTSLQPRDSVSLFQAKH